MQQETPVLAARTGRLRSIQGLPSAVPHFGVDFPFLLAASEATASQGMSQHICTVIATLVAKM